jgi:hypothetical protein
MNMAPRPDCNYRVGAVGMPTVVMDTLKAIGRDIIHHHTGSNTNTDIDTDTNTDIDTDTNTDIDTGTNTDIDTDTNADTNIKIDHNHINLKHGSINLKHGSINLKHGSINLKHGSINSSPDIRINSSPDVRINSSSAVRIKPLFKRGEGNFSMFRIPALLSIPIASEQSVVLAFAEGRGADMSKECDWCKGSIVMKRSTRPMSVVCIPPPPHADKTVTGYREVSERL